MVIISKSAYIVCASVGMNRHTLYPIECVVTYASSQGPMQNALLEQYTAHRHASGNVCLCSPTQGSTDVIGKIDLHVCIKDLPRKTTFGIVVNLVLNTVLGFCFIKNHIVGVLPQWNETVLCSSRKVFMPFLRTSDVHPGFIVAADPEITPVSVAANERWADRCSSKQARPETRTKGRTKVVSKCTGPICFERTQTVDQQGHLMPARDIMRVSINVPFEKIVANLNSTTECVAKQMVLCLSRKVIVNIIELKQVDKKRSYYSHNTDGFETTNSSRRASLRT